MEQLAEGRGEGDERCSAHLTVQCTTKHPSECDMVEWATLSTSMELGAHSTMCFLVLASLHEPNAPVCGLCKFVAYLDAPGYSAPGLWKD